MLTHGERKILESILETWVDNDMPLAGCFSYQDVIDICKKLGLETPKELEEIGGFNA